MVRDKFGRTFAKDRLAPPYYAVKVTGALFHTQGGLNVDERARVLKSDGTPFANLFAGGGAARGLWPVGLGILIRQWIANSRHLGPHRRRPSCTFDKE